MNHHGLRDNHGSIKVIIESSVNGNPLFKSTVFNGIEISTETVFEKLRLAAEAFSELSVKEQESGDHNLTADYYDNISIAFIKLSNDCIFKLNKDTSVKIDSLIDIVLEKIKTP